jgi:hypothetical protein
LLLAVLLSTAATAQRTMDHTTWDALLKQYVTPSSRVDYQRWKQDGAVELDGYLSALAQRWPEEMTSSARKAALINAYNALTIRWVLSHYPIKSIWMTRNPFQGVRHALDGTAVSLDEIESRLRETGDPRIHAVLVCAAVTCPPLRREAYVAGRLDEQLDDNTRRWLADPDLNTFSPEKRTVQVSEIFKWYRTDFEQNGGTLADFLAEYGPPGAAFLRHSEADIQFRPYEWALNDTEGAGSEYSKLEFYRDWAWNHIRAQAGSAKRWFLSLGERHGVNPIIFGSIYLGAIPFFSASIAWLVRNFRQGKSILAPVLCASFCFVSAYLYLIFAGRNIPAWVYIFIAGLLASGVYSTYRKIRVKLNGGEDRA